MFAIGLPGAITYYIEDSTSVTNYKRRTEVFAENASQFVGASSTQIENAADTLYDVYATVLDRRKNPIKSYELDIAYLPSHTWLVGDSFRLVYKGFDDQGVFINEDATVYVMSRREKFNAAGIGTE